MATYPQTVAAIVDRHPSARASDAEIVTISAETEAAVLAAVLLEESRWDQCEFSRVYATPSGHAIKGVCVGRVA